VDGLCEGRRAWADFEIKTPKLLSDPVSYSSNLFGWIGGAGIEVAFLRNVSAKAEYNYIRFSREDLKYLGFSRYPASSIASIW
jgi:opacity protein-like surface antigen